MSAQVVKDVLGSGLLSNPIRLLSVVSDAAAQMTTDSGMTVGDLVEIGESLHHLSSQNVQFLTAPNQPWSVNLDRVQFAQPQADEVFSAIAHDVTVPKVSTTPTPAPTSAQVLTTTSPSNVKVQVLNGSGIQGIAAQAAAGLTSRGFDVTGTGDAATFAYTNSVIEYASIADMAEVNTLKATLSDVTDLKDASLTPGTIELILGSDFTGLTAQASPSPSVTPTVQQSGSPNPTVSPTGSPSPTQGVTGLAASNGGITAAAACASDGSAFAGPESPQTSQSP